MENLCGPAAVIHTVFLLLPAATGRDRPLAMLRRPGKKCTAGISDSKTAKQPRAPVCSENKTNYKGETIMKTKQFKTALSRILCIVLIVAMALFTIGCGQQQEDETTNNLHEFTQVYEDGAVIGEGETEFLFTVTDKDGNSKNFTVKTDCETVGRALQEVKIIYGEMGDYGLFVTEVNGIVAIYDLDNTYWAFYEDGQYALAGVDKTAIVPGTSYELRVEK